MNNRWAGERGPYKRMVSGRKFYLNDPRPEDFHLPDIIHHLSRLPRYDGATTYTVGQHCVVASWMAALHYPQHPLLPAQMLIHDFVEAYYGDVSSPLKSLLFGYKVLETSAEMALEDWLGVRFLDDPLVKEVDDRMWLTERLVLWPDLPIVEDYDGPLLPFAFKKEAVLESYFLPWSTETLEDLLKKRFRDLFPEKV